mmetsp:Transcript_32556/g.73550  ORF Transcript_32556/g.73550 Transcript_32556/m.73550 type:complete len:495 (+) Transcript_32556:82-1566(+)
MRHACAALELLLLAWHGSAFHYFRFTDPKRGLPLLTLAAAESPSELAALTVPALKDLCRERKLKVSGTKAVLVDRLVDSAISGVAIAPTPHATTSSSTSSRTSSSRLGDKDVFLSAPGETSHTYRRARDDSLGLPISRAKLDGLLAKREAARNGRDYKSADSLRLELEAAGISVSDSGKTWRVTNQPDGVTNRSDNVPHTKGTHQGSYSALERWPAPEPERDKNDPWRGSDFTRSRGDSSDLSRAQLVEVAALLEERCEARNARDFAEADALRVRLREGFGVTILDRTMEWRADGRSFAAGQQGGGGGGRGYARSSDDTVDLDAAFGEGASAEAAALVAKRGDAKRARDYALADELRARLREQFRVEVDDLRREWRADGVLPRPSSDPSFPMAGRSFGQSGHDYSRAPDDESLGLQGSDGALVTLVDGMLARRLKLRLTGDFPAADRLRDQFAHEHNVRVDDANKLWRADGKGGERGFRGTRQGRRGCSSPSRH